MRSVDCSVDIGKLVEIEQHQADLGQCSGAPIDCVRQEVGQKIAVGGHGFFESIGLPGFFCHHRAGEGGLVMG